jgi:hypothetical protein
VGVARSVRAGRPHRHRYLWAELPRIRALVDKIATVHADRHPELFEVQRLYDELRAHLEPHLTREEQESFPRIRQLAEAVDSSSVDTRDLAAQIDALIGEHETFGALLDGLRRVTSGYAVPGDGCASYAADYRALADWRPTPISACTRRTICCSPQFGPIPRPSAGCISASRSARLIRWAGWWSTSSSRAIRVERNVACAVTSRGEHDTAAARLSRPR